jgi:beta-1,4-mannosyltransferase
MTISNGLLERYLELEPELECVYITPDIRQMAQNDPYPTELYRSVLAAQQEGRLRVETGKILSPRILWRRLRGERSIVHHHFFEIRDVNSFLNVLWKTLLLTLYDIAGGTIVWTIHNTYPHQRTMMFFIVPLRWYIARVSTILHVHCREAVYIMSDIFGLPPEKFFVVPHPLYSAVFMKKSEARQELARRYTLTLPEDRPVLLMLGAIAQYKGIDEAIALLSTLDNPPVLVVAGAVKKSNENYAANIRAAAREFAFLRLVEQRIPASDMPFFYNATDYVLFNYTDILTSGGVAWAISYRKPIIIPRKGCLCELGGNEVYSFNTPEELEAILRSLKKPAGEA